MMNDVELFTNVHLGRISFANVHLDHCKSCSPTKNNLCQQLLSTPMPSKVKHRQPKKLSIDELVEAAERSEATGDFNYAVKLITTAIQKADRSSANGSTKEPGEDKNRSVLLELLERRAELYISLHFPDSAVQDFQRSLELLDDGPSLPDDNGDDQQRMELDHEDTSNGILQRKVAIHMNLGQLSTGMEALSYYKRGVDCLLKAQQSQQHDTSTPDHDDAIHTEHQQLLAKAYTSIAELYLTDLCFEDSAESSCEHHLQLALQCDSNSVDALQTLASLQLSQQKPQDAKITIRKVYDQVQTGCRALATLVGLRGDDDDDDPADDATTNHQMAATELVEFSAAQALPTLEFRCQTAKLLLETHQSSEAIDVIGSVLAENDEIIEVWILAGDAFDALEQQRQEQKVLSDDRDREIAADEDNDQEPPPQIHYWERAMEMLTVVRGELEQQLQDDHNNDDDDALQQQMDQVEAQMEDLRTKLDEASKRK
jgi:hypothetical protein